MLRNKHGLQGIGSFGVRVLDCVEIALGRCEIAVTEPRLHLLEIHTGVQQQSCRSMTQTVKLADFEAVSLQKLPELLGRRLIVHDGAVPLREHPVLIMPCCAELLSFLLLFLFQKLNQSRNLRCDGYDADIIILRRFGSGWFAAQLVCGPLKQNLVILAVSICKFQRDQFAQTSAGDDCKLNTDLELQRFILQGINDCRCFLLAEDLNCRLNDLRQRQLLGICRTAGDDAELDRLPHDALQADQFPLYGRCCGHLSVRLGRFGDHLHKALHMNRLDLRELHVTERRNDELIDIVSVRFQSARCKRILYQIEIHSAELGQFHVLLRADLTLLTAVLKVSRNLLQFFLDAFFCPSIRHFPCGFKRFQLVTFVIISAIDTDPVGDDLALLVLSRFDSCHVQSAPFRSLDVSEQFNEFIRGFTEILPILKQLPLDLLHDLVYVFSDKRIHIV